MEVLICRCSQKVGILRMLDAWKRTEPERWREKGREPCRDHLFVIAKRVSVGLPRTVLWCLAINVVKDLKRTNQIVSFGRS
jgi:hypothetical protein